MKRFLGFSLAAAGLAVLSLTAQTPSQTKGKAAPKSESCHEGQSHAQNRLGDPDLQGTWFVTEDVPLERSAANASKEFLTDAEIAESDARKGINPGRNSRDANAAQDVSGAYNAVFNSVLKTGRRTSRITSPSDGRIPALVNPPQGRGAAAPGGAGRGADAILGVAAGQNDNPETAAQSPRCLGVALPFPLWNTAFAQGTVMQLVQGPKSIGIYMEDDHAGGGNRTIHMDGKHPPANVKLFLGDSRGHWEGNTLVVRDHELLHKGLPRIRTSRPTKSRAFHAPRCQQHAARDHLRRSGRPDQALGLSKSTPGRLPRRPPHDLRLCSPPRSNATA